MGKGESVVWQIQKIAFFQTNVILILEGKLMQEEKEQGRVCSGLRRIFPLADCYLQNKLKRYFLSFLLR